MATIKPRTDASRMSPEEFKAEVHRRGWTYRALAKRWGVSENWVSKVARNPNRASSWDDAVRGLPIVMAMERAPRDPNPFST